MPATIPTRLALVAALGAALALPAHAVVMIDDFSTGAFSGAFAAGPAPADPTYHRQQTGTMASGYRDWYLLVRGDPSLGALVDITPAGFDLRTNMGVGHRFDWFYGETYVGHDHSMLLDLSHENTLRFSFDEVERGLNFNVLVYFRHQINNYAQLGVNIAPTHGPVNVDFAFSDFVAADPSRPADFSQVSGIYIVTQSGGYYAGGGESFRMTSISAVPEVPSAALLLAGLPLLAWRRRRG
jgi:hypothetical protein